MRTLRNRKHCVGYYVAVIKMTKKWTLEYCTLYLYCNIYSLSCYFHVFIFTELEKCRIPYSRRLSIPRWRFVVFKFYQRDRRNNGYAYTSTQKLNSMCCLIINCLNLFTLPISNCRYVSTYRVPTVRLWGIFSMRRTRWKVSLFIKNWWLISVMILTQTQQLAQHSSYLLKGHYWWIQAAKCESIGGVPIQELKRQYQLNLQQ